MDKIVPLDLRITVAQIQSMNRSEERTNLVFSCRLHSPGTPIFVWRGTLLGTLLQPCRQSSIPALVLGAYEGLVQYVRPSQAACEIE